MIGLDLLGVSVEGGGGGGGAHHGGHHGGGARGPWPIMPYPIPMGPAYFDPAPTTETEIDIDLDALAERLAEKLAKKKGKKAESVRGLDILGAVDYGSGYSGRAFDHSRIGDQVEDDAKAIGKLAKKLSTLKVVPVSIAQSILKGGYEAMDAADKSGMGNRTNGRAVIRGHLDWHRDALAKAASPYETYAAADDLKKWVVDAYIEANIEKYGAASAAASWSRMWDDIEANIKSLPADIASKVHDTFVATIAAALGIPTWAVPAGAAVIVAGLGYAGYKIAVAAAPTVARRYLP